MKKKLIVLCLALALAGCGQANAPAPTATPEPTPEVTLPPEELADGVEEAPGTAEPSAYLSGLVDDIYAACPVELMMLETAAIPVDDADWLRYQAGLGEEWIGRVEEAVVSQSMTGSQAYSLVLLQLPTAEDAQEAAAAMLEGADLAKWVCVMADKARAVSFDKVALLAMADSNLVDVDALVDAVPGALQVEFAFDESREQALS